MEHSDIKISLMTLKDLNELKTILEIDFDDFWNYSIFKSELNNPYSTYFVMRKSSEIIGFSGLLKVFDTADITNIVIKKSYRGNGFSKLLLEYLINYCKANNISQINLEVNSNNVVAISLYKFYGFVEVGLRKNYYSNGDGILYTKFL